MTNDKIMETYLDCLQKSLIWMDDASASSLQQIRDIQVAGRVIMQLRLRKLKHELGDDHPRVEAVSEALDHNLGVINELEVRLERSRIKIPEVVKDDVLVHGIIADERERGISDAKIALFDGSGNDLAMCASTDDAGYFSFVLNATALEKIRDRKILYSVFRSDGELMYRHSEPIELALSDRKMAITIVDRKVAYPWLRKTKDAPSRVDKKKMPTEIITRYLGNSKSREFHDLKNTKKNCQIDEITEAHRVQFRTQKDAQTEGYDFCSYCFSRQQSKR